MPAKIDRLGRTHEWLTSAELNRSGGNADAAARDENEAAKYEAVLSPEDKHRVRVAAKRSADWIQRAIGSGRVVESTVIGEASKKPGGPDYDLDLSTSDGTHVGYSLKLQSNSSGVNLRNPTLDSFLKAVANLSFKDTLAPDDWNKYVRQGERYSRDEIASKEVGRWAVPRIVDCLIKAHKGDPAEFVARLLRQMRVKTNLLLTVVEEDGRFVGYVTRFKGTAAALDADPGGLKIEGRGISVVFRHKGVELCHLDLYMLSYSGGKGNRLRAALRADFDLDT